jgi:hypothetical protein
VASWGFIGLAYGVGAVVLLGYLITLKGRLRNAAAELTALERGRGARER